jgi:hypothetical protein
LRLPYLNLLDLLENLILFLYTQTRSENQAPRPASAPARRRVGGRAALLKKYLDDGADTGYELDVYENIIVSLSFLSSLFPPGKERSTGVPVRRGDPAVPPAVE